MEEIVADWVDTVAQNAETDRDLVTDVFTRYGVVGPKAVPTRRQLRVDAIHFAGVKNLLADVDEEARRFVPFSFHRSFATPVTAFVSDGKNDAGKSSTLEILKWGLRGSSKVAGDVQKWLRQVCLLLTIGGERILIAWRVDDGVPKGQILVLPVAVGPGLDAFSAATIAVMTEHSDQAATAGESLSGLEAPVDGLIERLLNEGALTIDSFDGHDEMESSVSDFMLQRLGLDALTQWTRVAGATDADDGNLVDHGWHLWSQALAITKPSESSVIGESPFHARNVLNTFLATEWGATKLSARAQKKAVDGRLAGIHRRRNRDSESREASAQVLRAEKVEAESELQSIPVSGMTAEEVEAALSAVTAATAALTRTQRAVSDSALAYGSAERELHAAEQDLTAFKEAAVTKRFWHALKPSCCPRCDAKVQPEQWQREQEGSCSLCNNPIDEAGAAPDTAVGAVEGDDIDDDLDPVTMAGQRVTQHTADSLRLSALYDDAISQAKAAETEFERASEVINNVHGDPIERRALERRIAVLDGRIQERSEPFDEDPEEEALTTDARVLEAAEAFAGVSAKNVFSEALSSVSAQITSLGKSLGISNLEKATLQANAQLPVVKGGEKTPFGKLTDGEKLRLKIALVVALLDVGTTSGLGRHPGLLIVDSLATEELNRGNGELLLRELFRVAQTYGLQIITSTAHSELVAAVLADDAIQRPTTEDLMW
ncbi:hypothetical protein ASF79_15870 [Agreia sp. Leaf335]|uniref:hypothetical protein n=1 Tax=Agreia sp. Leaf335 TaxID=1736340 RepID=UPI0006F7AEBC|nr:hypothetical protein [Agreia sp. Leaf335]KQR19146.1 hypothetical protein ASF79_15870 [Agreia sp. Leaf335]